MNYLAHAYLSFNNTELLVGNMMGDFIKGNKYNLYQGDIQKGILLHRAIDHYTDHHELNYQAMSFLKPSFRLSSGIFTDILFDHFLANHTAYFNIDSLKGFTSQIHNNLDLHQHLFNDEMKTFFGYMTQFNWLYNYRFESGLEKSILGMCKRYPRLGNGNKAMELILLNKSELSALFDLFFPQLVAFSKDWIQSYNE